MANVLPTLALLLWLPLTLGLFYVVRPQVAVLVSILGAGLLLPAGFALNVTGLPPLTRESVSVLAVLLGLILRTPRLLTTHPPPRGPEWLVLLMILGAFGSAWTNNDPRVVGVKFLPAVPTWAALSRTFDILVLFALPFYFGRTLFRRPKDLYVALLALVVAGLLYSLPILWEARMSPHLHDQLYGYQPGSFRAARRDLFGLGWRPMVFVGHGLALAMFAVTALAAAIALWYSRLPFLGPIKGWVAAYLYGIVLVCSSLAAIVYASVTMLLAMLARPRVNAVAILVLATLTVGYPALRATNLFPTQALVETARSVSEDRAQSLAHRFENEEILLEHARERVLFGWGGYGRNRKYDPETGRDLSNIDGYWIGTLGNRGIVGLVAAFGLLLYPAYAAVRRTWRSPSSVDARLVLGAGWIVTLNAIDLLPNAFLQTRTVLFAGIVTGALWGWERRRAPVRRPARRLSKAASREEALRERPASLARARKG